MRKVKVLNFPMGNTMGGITRYALTNGAFINRDLIQFDYAAIQRISNPSIFMKNGSRFYQLSCYPYENIEKFREEFNEILDEKYDVIHIHTRYWSDFLVEEIAKQRNVQKIIVHAHTSEVILNMDFQDSAYQRKKEMLTRKHYEVRSRLTEEVATEFWTCSKEASQWLYGDKIPEDKIFLLENSIDVSKFVYREELRNKIRKDMSIQEKFVIGHVGRFSPEKNQQFLIKVFKKLREQEDNVVFMFVGDGPTQNTIKKMVAEYELNKNVLFLGQCENVSELLQVMDVFCLPSIKEGFPISLVEAQSADLSCIASSNITKDINLLGKVKFVDLEIEQWVEEILKIKKEMAVRKDMYKEMTIKGYNIREQIRKLEKKYVKGII